MSGRAVATHSETTEVYLIAAHTHPQHSTNATSDPPPLEHEQTSYSQPTHMPSTHSQPAHSLPTPSPVSTVDHEFSPVYHDPQISSQESRYESARTLAQEFRTMTTDFNSSPTTRSESTLPLHSHHLLTIVLTPMSSAITSKAQAQSPTVTLVVADTTVSRNPTHVVMKQ